MSPSNSLDFASLFHGVPPLPPPPPPIPNPTGRRRRKGKEQLLAGKRFWADPPKPTTTLPAKAPQVQDEVAVAQIRKDERFDRTNLKARVRKLLVVDDKAEDARPRKPTLNVFAVVKKPAGRASKPANKQRPKAVKQDPSYRPDKWSSSESEEDSDWDFVPGDLPAFGQVKGQEQFSPVTTSSLTCVSPQRPTRPPPPPPIPNPLKRKRIEDPTYRPSRNSEESSFDDDDEEDDGSDEGVEALKRLKLGKNNKKVKKRGGRVAERQREKSPEKDKRDMLTKGNGDEMQKPINKKGKSVWDPSYKPPRDEEDDSDEYSDEYTSTDGGSRQRRKKVRVRERGDGPKDKNDDNAHLDDNPKNDVIPQEKLLPCQARPCLPPKFGRRKIKQRNRHKPPRIYDPSYKPGTTSTDDDSNNTDSSWSSSEEGKDRKKRKNPQPKAPKTLQTVSDLQHEVIRLMLKETKSASAMTKKRKRPRILRRHTSDQSFRPSDTTSDEYSDEWYSSEYSSSELDVKNKKRKKGMKKKKDQPNVNRNSPGFGPVTGTREDLDCGSPVEASEETRESVKPEKQPASRKTGRRRIGTLAIDGTHKPSADSESSEFESEPISGLDHSVSSMKTSNDDPKPELIFEPKGQDSIPPVNLEGETPQVQTPSRPLSNIKTAFYPLCHGRYSPWPPARGTVYCQPCFREQVVVRGLLIRRGISETMRLLKVLLGGGSDFGKELDEALEKLLGGVETEQVRSTRVEDYGQGQDEEDEREERVQRGEDTHTKPMPSAQSSPSELPEDVQTLLVLRRLSDIVNTRSTPTLSTAYPSGSDVSPTMPFSLYFPSIANAASSKPSHQQQDPTGPSRYSSPLPPCPALIPQGEAHNRTGNGAGIKMSYFCLKPPSTRSIISLPSPNPLDNAINILHDAIGISTWQARRLWNQYEGSGIWDLAQVDSLVEKSHAKCLKNSDIEVGMGNDENHQAVMLELESLAQLEEEIRNAFAEKGSREEENEGRTRQSDGGGTGATRSIMFGAVTAGQAGRKRSREDDDDDCRLGRDHAQPPNKKCKLIKPIDLLKSQEAMPDSPQTPREKPRMIPCHSCSGFNTANYNSCAAVRRNDYIEMGGRPWVKTLQWTLDINESEAAKMTLNSFLDLISRSGKAAHVNSSGWEFVVHRPGDDNDAETRVVFLDVRPGLDLHL
ncbi:hypothetical protein B0H65DRAFT_178794 [Neurospora tetraspora]|uniref:G protein gamma domain-containing protein n=1 Tax=Neurospora tetraspora TaxID=94610 RepID=A0AAE0JIJ0_9PEZI|nr:hypothetical protein B0H65DRAFT_178794 [Neurospora tetraspora]